MSLVILCVSDRAALSVGFHSVCSLLDLGLSFALHSQGARLHALATLPVYSTVLCYSMFASLEWEGRGIFHSAD